MIKGIFSIKDTKSEFMTPFVHFSDVTAVREITAAVNAPSANPISQNPGDFELWHIGNFDTTTGAVESCAEFVCNCNTLVKVVTE